MAGRRGSARSDSRSTYGNLTPRGEGAGTPRGARAGIFGAGRTGDGAAFGGSAILSLAEMQAELDQAEQNAHHNRRAGHMYAKGKRPARRNDASYPEKRTRCVVGTQDKRGASCSAHMTTCEKFDRAMFWAGEYAGKLI